MQNTNPTKKVPYDMIISFLMEDVYAKDNEVSMNILHKIIDKNQNLTGNDKFMFNNKVYHKGAKTWFLAPTLHQSLHAEMRAWCSDRLAIDRQEKFIVKALFVAVCNVAKTPDNWKKLLPESLHNDIDTVFAHMYYCYPTEHPLTDAQVEQFMVKQERALNTLKGRIALNVLL